MPWFPTPAVPSEHGVIWAIVGLEGSGSGVESPACDVCSGYRAVYSDFCQVVEGIYRELQYVWTEFDAAISFGVGLFCHPAQEVGETFARRCRRHAVMVAFVRLDSVSHSDKLGCQSFRPAIGPYS
jgi:hypothetical protein